MNIIEFVAEKGAIVTLDKVIPLKSIGQGSELWSGSNKASILGREDNDLKYFFPMVDIYREKKEAKFSQAIVGDKDIIGVSNEANFSKVNRNELDKFKKAIVLFRDKGDAIAKRLHYPDPLYSPAQYRMYNGRLFVLWGFTPKGVKPLTVSQLLERIEYLERGGSNERKHFFPSIFSMNIMKFKEYIKSISINSWIKKLKILFVFVLLLLLFLLMPKINEFINDGNFTKDIPTNIVPPVVPPKDIPTNVVPPVVPPKDIPTNVVPPVATKRYT